MRHNAESIRVPAYCSAPNWVVPPHVHCYVTSRWGGISQAGFATQNLALHVEDDSVLVLNNRQALALRAQQPLERWCWMNQVHGTQVVEARTNQIPQADAMIVREPQRVGVVMTADCLPVVLVDVLGTELAVVHAGWRGLAASILDRTLASMRTPPERLMAWLGPAIQIKDFMVGSEVLEAFIALNPKLRSYFLPVWKRPNVYQASLPGLAKACLMNHGVANCYQGYATLNYAQPWYSYRRQKVTGRIATFAWLENC